MTRFQGQVLDQAQIYENKKEEEQREEARQGQQPQRNARAGGVDSGGNGDMGTEETVRYINKQENPDHPVHNS